MVKDEKVRLRGNNRGANPNPKMGQFLLVTIQVDMHDRLALTLQDDLTEQIVKWRARGVLSIFPPRNGGLFYRPYVRNHCIHGAPVGCQYRGGGNAALRRDHASGVGTLAERNSYSFRCRKREWPYSMRPLPKIALTRENIGVNAGRKTRDENHQL